MRCNNCGWTNPAGATTCQKCNQPLQNSASQPSSAAFNPRATMVEMNRPEANPRATMVDANPMAGNPRATMAEVNPMVYNPRATVAEVSPIVSNPRATMVDAQPTNTADPRATLFDVVPETRIYKLFCMDDPAMHDIQIAATDDFGLAPGDIIFIKNLRYQVKQ